MSCLQEQGYQEDIDSDGDIAFKAEGRNFYIIVVQKLQFLNNNRLKTTKNMDFVRNPCFLGDL
jgi:hypothetical protein